MKKKELHEKIKIRRFVLSKFVTLSDELIKYRKVARSNTTPSEAHDGFFRLLMKGIFDPYVKS